MKIIDNWSKSFGIFWKRLKYKWRITKTWSKSLPELKTGLSKKGINISSYDDYFLWASGIDMESVRNQYNTEHVNDMLNSEDKLKREKVEAERDSQNVTPPVYLKVGEAPRY